MLVMTVFNEEKSAKGSKSHISGHLVLKEHAHTQWNNQL